MAVAVFVTLFLLLSDDDGEQGFEAMLRETAQDERLALVITSLSKLVAKTRGAGLSDAISGVSVSHAFQYPGTAKVDQNQMLRFLRNDDVIRFDVTVGDRFGGMQL